MEIKKINWIRLSENDYFLITVNCYLKNVRLTTKSKLLITEEIRKGGNSEYTYYRYKISTSLKFEELKFIEQFIENEIEYDYRGCD